MESGWDRVAEIFEGAMDRPVSERCAFLDRECEGDEALRREVDSLLAHDKGSSMYLRSAVSTAAESAQGLLPGERIGGYEILRQIGVGGMGAVYLAVRADDTYRRHVALKVVKRGMDTDFVLARFRRERQILAALEHPSIARLYDGGTTGDGRPYLVMEYVEGLPVAEYCKQQAPPLRERLRLFVEVCGAVEAAHRFLIVHRDLKPSNILVKSNGGQSKAEVKLLDFGIAKLLNDDLSETAALTQTSMRLLTPEYASPEQVRQNAVTTSTDIYALGLVLYEMLTGERAHKIRDLPTGEWEKWVLETEPAKASSVPGPFGTALDGDLDNIVAKALRKEPERRYLTVQEFRDDIERYLTDQPVSARPDEIGYRAAKFVRRHRIPVIAAALIVLSLLAGAGIALHQAQIASQHAARAERRFAQVRTLARSLIFDLDTKIQNLPGSAPARESLVKTSLEYLDSLSVEAAGDADLQAELAEAYFRVAMIQGGQFRANLGRTPEAEMSLKKALALQEALVKARPGDANQTLALAKTLIGVSDLDAKQGRINTAFADQAIEKIEAVAQRTPADAKVQNALAEAYTHAYARYLNLNWPKALDSAIRSLEAAERANRLEPGKHLTGLYGGLLRAGRSWLRQGDVVKSREAFERAMATLDEILVHDPLHTKMNRERAFVRQQLSRALVSPFNPQGPDFEAAAKRLDEAVEIVRKLEKTDQGNVLRFFDVCVMETESVVIHAQLDPRRALRHVENARRAITEYVKLEPNHAYAKTVPIEIDIEASRALIRLKNWGEAERLLSGALTAKKDRSVLRNAELWAKRAWVRLQMGRMADAESDANIVAKALSGAAIKDVEIRELLAQTSYWADVAAVRRGLRQPALAAEALSRRKNLFNEIRKRGFRTPHIDRLEAEA